MSIQNQIRELLDEIGELQSQLFFAESRLCDICDPLFAEQARLAKDVSEEPEFDPYWAYLLTLDRTQTVLYDCSSRGVFAVLKESNREVYLLPEILEGKSEREKLEAVREVFRKAIKESKP